MGSTGISAVPFTPSPNVQGHRNSVTKTHKYLGSEVDTLDCRLIGKRLQQNNCLHHLLEWSASRRPLVSEWQG